MGAGISQLLRSSDIPDPESAPGAVSAGKVLFAATGKKNEAVGEEDSLTVVVRKQEAALKKLEQKHGAGYGKPPPGSKSEARGKGIGT